MIQPSLYTAPPGVASLPVSAFADVLERFEPISLAEAAAMSLLDRIDTKFLLCDWQLLDILEQLADRYWVLQVGPTRLHSYRTLYFDTPDYYLYLQHQNDAGSRHKVRIRFYEESNRTFVEVKHKTNRRRTVKSRLEVPDWIEELDGEARRFVAAHCPLDEETLTPVIWNGFRRMTLISKQRRERLTLDIGFHYGWQERCGATPMLAIAEVKQPKFTVQSDFVRCLRAYHLQRTGFSKYCTGMADLYPFLKHNRFKRRLLLIKRLYRQRGCP